MSETISSGYSKISPSHTSDVTASPIFLSPNSCKNLTREVLFNDSFQDLQTCRQISTVS
eukprot:04255.XXX_552_728_1 [CDS] Oithona nana genome sequencing.